jgi:ATP-dependent helicase/nuclease subunit A
MITYYYIRISESGPKYINYDRRIEYNTLAKEAIKIQAKNEMISEEMRVLYVALTRAREKLIITGTKNKAREDLENKREIINRMKQNKEKQSKIGTQIIKKNKTYLDWLELVCLYKEDDVQDNVDIKVHDKKEILKESIQETEKITSKDIQQQLDEKYKLDENKTKEMDTNIQAILEWKYPNIEVCFIPGKLSVSEIKGLNNRLDINEENTDVNILTKKIKGKPELKQPKFLNPEEKYTNAQKGTIMHTILQKLDLKKDYTKTELCDFIDQLVLNNVIQKEEAEIIDKERIYQFLNSDLAKDIKKAEVVCKEKPFYMNIPVNQIYDISAQDNILVQGIIDLYYIDENHNVILVDYKTDYVEKQNEIALIEKYRKQLEIYKQALEKSLNKKVSKTIIYSLYLNKSIEVNI